MERYYDTEYFRCARDFHAICEATPENSDVTDALAKLQAYYAALREADVSDAAVVRCPGSCAGSFCLGLLWLVPCLIITIFALPAWAFFFPYFALSNWMVQNAADGYVEDGKKYWKEQPEDFEGLDVRHTYRQLFSYPLLSLFFTIYSIVAAIFLAPITEDEVLSGSKAYIYHPVGWWFVVFFILPVILGVWGVLTFDWGCQAWSICGSYFRAVCCGKGQALTDLKVSTPFTYIYMYIQCSDLLSLYLVV